MSYTTSNYILHTPPSLVPGGTRATTELFVLHTGLVTGSLYSTPHCTSLLKTHQDKVVHTAVWVEAGVFHDDCLTTTKATEALIVCSSSPYSPLLSLCYRLPLPLTRLLVRGFHHHQWQLQDILVANLLE